MNRCKKCNEPYAASANFCPSCGTGFKSNPSTNTSNSSAIIVLCTLTIVGSIFTIFRGLLYEMVSDLGNDTYIRGWIYVGSSVGTMVGAFMMIGKQLNGLYVYTVAQVIYILTVVGASLSYGELGGFVSSIFLIPSFLFLIFYWTMAREYLD